jgi:signal transduction histidine kinase
VPVDQPARAGEGVPAGASPGLRRLRHSVRGTLRLRLTLLYGVVFVAAGAGLLAVTYGLFKHSQATQKEKVSIPTVQFELPANAKVSFFAGKPPTASALTARPPTGGGGGAVRSSGGRTITSVPATGSGGSLAHNSVRVPPRLKPSAAKVLKQIRQSGQRQLVALARIANVRLKVAQSNDASSLLEWSGIALVVLALLSIALAWWLSGRALRPLRTMNTRAREISAENLHERLGVGARGDELGELAATFDALLGRLEGAFDSQRRFVANASHELRTPITLERTLLEVALADPDASVESLRQICQRVVASTEQQERLLDALLTLARSEAGAATGETVDLAALAEDALLSREGRLNGITVESRLEPAVVVGDEALLERLVANLLDNAIVHNDGDARWIKVRTGELEGAPGLWIANGGEVVDPARVEELFEPFRRGTGERVGGRDGGLGLGLSIVRAVAAAHAAKIEAHAPPAGGLEFELRFISEAAAQPTVGSLETVTA